MASIIGLGNPLLDISSPVEKDVLEKYELQMNNAILAEEKHLPLYEELSAMETAEYIGGGATLNSIRVAQWMLQKEGATAYSGCIGVDKFGKLMEKVVAEAGVNAVFQKNADTPTGTCAVLINDKERSLVANLAAANKFTVDHVQTTEVADVITAGKIFYMAGFFLTVSLDTIMHVAKHAHDNEKIVAMNLSAPFIPQFFGEPLAKAMPYVHFLFGNESEAKVYGETNKLTDTSVEGVAKHIAALSCEGNRSRTVVFTQGSDCTIVVRDGQVQKFDVTPIANDEIVDVNGAGDAFVGGFLSKLVDGKDMEACVQAGHYSAGYIIKRSGCTLEGKPDY